MGHDLFLNYRWIEEFLMLAVFTNLLNSKKISGPRLELRLIRPSRTTDCYCEWIASRKRSRQNTKVVNTEETKDENEKSKSVWGFCDE